MGYVDTSVLVAYYCRERRSKAVQKTLERIAEPAISSLVEVEFHSAIAMKVRTGDLNVATANQVLSLFRMHVADGLYGVMTVGPRQYALACDWIGGLSTPLRTLDALHLAVAFSNGLPIITADKGLAKSAASLGVRHQLLA